MIKNFSASASALADHLQNGCLVFRFMQKDYCFIILLNSLCIPHFQQINIPITAPITA